MNPSDLSNLSHEETIALVQKLEEEKKQADEKAKKAEEEKRQAEEEKRQAEEEKRQAEEEKRQAEEDKRQAEEEKKVLEDEKKKADEKAKKADKRARVLEDEKKQAQGHVLFANEEKNLHRKEFAKFKNMGDSLADDNHQKAFSRYLEGFLREHRKCTVLPYIFVMASSGFGKTQLAFSLNKHRVVYVPLSDTQDIYLHFHALSSSLLSCVKKDMELLDLPANCDLREVSTRSVSRKTRPLGSGVGLFTTGLLLKLIEMSPKEGLLDPSRLKGFEVVAREASSLGRPSIARPTVILDEFSPSGEWTLRRLMFLRNFLRVHGFTVVVMGTNAAASNMFSMSAADSSREDITKLWCVLWKSLPNMSGTLLGKIHGQLDRISGAHPQLAESCVLLEKLVATERPLMGVLLSSFLKSCSRKPRLLDTFDNVAFLEKCLREFYSELVRRKRFHESPFGNKGQLVALRGTIEGVAFLKTWELINSHFAVLAIDTARIQFQKDAFLEITIKDGVEGCQVMENPLEEFDMDEVSGSVFRPFSEETLLRLSLGGGPKRTCLANAGRRVSVRRVLKELGKKTKLLDASPQNPLAHKNDGVLLENLFLYSFVVASREKGLAGLAFSEWLGCFLWELSGSGDMGRFLAGVELTGLWFGAARIPCMAPANDGWNDAAVAWSRAVGVPLGTCALVPDASGVDFVSHYEGRPAPPLVTGECKNWDKKIALSDLKEMIPKALKHGAACHIVLANTFSGVKRLKQLEVVLAGSSSSLYVLERSDQLRLCRVAGGEGGEGGQSGTVVILVPLKVLAEGAGST